jgi:hypothetical protein
VYWGFFLLPNYDCFRLKKDRQSMTDKTNTTVPAVPQPVTPFTKDQLEYIQQITVATAMAVSGAQKAASPGPNQRVPEECLVCKQQITACKGEHVKMVVFPVKYPEFMPFFPGAKINGVTYLSRNESDEITVPKCTVSTITNIIHAFEQNEKTVMMGRNKTHNSGSIGKKGTGFNPANAAWR